MKSATRALKINKIPVKKDTKTTKSQKETKNKILPKANTKINLPEVKNKKEENINKNKPNNEMSKSHFATMRTRVKTLFRKPIDQMTNITVSQNEPSIKKKKKQEDEITDHSVASKKSIMKDGVLLIDDPKLKKMIEESKRRYAKRFLKNGENNKSDNEYNENNSD